MSDMFDMKNHSQYYFLFDNVSQTLSSFFQANTDDEAKRMIVSSIRQSNKYERLVINDKVLRRVDIGFDKYGLNWDIDTSLVCPCSDLVAQVLLEEKTDA